MNKPKTPPNLGSDFLLSMGKLARNANENAQNAWLSDYRQSQIEQLDQAQFPNAKVEHFKYNRLNVFETNSFDILAEASNEVLDVSERQIAGLHDDGVVNQAVNQVVIVNGKFSQALSQIKGHHITPFSEANNTQQRKILAQLEGQSSIAHNPFVQINASLTDNGILIEIDESSSQSIIEILSIIDSNATQCTLASHIIIDVANNSKATVVNRSLSSENTNLSTEQILVNVGENAHFTHYDLQLEHANGLHFGSSEYNIQSNATLKTFHAATGSILKKLDITVNHLGQHAHAFVNGLFAATDNQQVDYHTTINHPKPNGQTDEIFRGIVNCNAEATFNGRIHILEQAQKTLAQLSNKNLVLSDNAVIHTKPELEIYADDVICAHGATVSRMNDESLNYLRARGIPKQEAELMLSYGFFNEVLAELEHEAVADYLRPILFKRFTSQ